MEKLKSNIAAKIAAVAVFIISFCLFCMSVAGVVVLDGEGLYQTDKEAVKKDLYESVCEKYSIVALSGYQDDFQMKHLAKTNFRYGVVKADDIDKVDLSKQGSYLVHNFGVEMPEKDKAFIYQQTISKDTYFSYGENLWDNFHVHDGTGGSYDLIELPNDGYYYNYTSDQLYVRSGSRLFPVFAESVYLQDDAWGADMLADECQKKGEDGTYVWAKDFEGITLEHGETDFIDAKQIKIVNDSAMEKIGKVVDVEADYEMQGIANDMIHLLEYQEVPVENYYVVSYVQEPLKGEQTLWKGDMFVQAKLLIDFIYRMRYSAIWILFISFGLLVASFIFLMSAAGHRKGQEGVCLGFADKIPLDIYFAAVCTIECLLFAILGSIFYATNWFHVSVGILFVFAVIAGILAALAFCMSFAVNVKLGKWWQKTAAYWICAKCWKFIRTCQRRVSKVVKILWKSLPLLWKAWVLFGAIAIVEFFAIVSCAYDAGALVTLWFLKCLLLCPLMIFALLQMNRLQKGAQKIANGALDYQVDTSRMFPEMKKHGEYLNDIGTGMNRAVSERMKSERFKTELITNVSHDIKTPLTSIINYVDLLQKEQTEHPATQEYLDVLSRQSARLKKLIEDLIEASKASSGSLSVTWEQCNMGVMLVQTAGEFEEKLMQNEIKLQIKKPEQTIYIKADSRHLWRVFDNLMNNICKYAQPSTRAYVDIRKKQEGGQVEITFRNISKYQLNISSDELMERFVRGDSSRNSEGSGLGLSIAKSLTELMGGTFQLVIDGDLFKVILTFPAA